MKEAPTSEPRGLPDFLAAYAHRGFRLLWAGAFLSSVGTWIQDVALSWIIHSRMGDPFYLGLRSFAQEVPLLAFMLLGGAVADRIAQIIRGNNAAEQDTVLGLAVDGPRRRLDLSRRRLCRGMRRCLARCQ